jgi:hypothetical protein
VVSGGNLFVANAFSATIGEYTTNGVTVNASLVSGLGEPVGIAVLGGDLFVSSIGGSPATVNTIGEYTTNGVAVNASLVSGLHQPWGIAVIPEPTTLALAGFSGLSLLLFLRRRK